MSDAVLVTGAFGLVGRACVEHLAALGRRVVATDLDTPANRKAAAGLPAGVAVQRADLTDPEQVSQLVSAVEPAAIIHLAAVIPPLCYANPAVARRVNVEATANLTKSAAAQSSPPRFVLASSIAVYGPATPATTTPGSPPTGWTPPRHRNCLAINIIRGRRCSPRPPSGWAGSGTRSGWSRQWRGNTSGRRRAGVAGLPSVPGEFDPHRA